MIIFPAIDLYEGCAVRLLRGDYANMTVYSKTPIDIARKFEDTGATHIHIVDLEGARDGTTPNIDTVEQIARNTHLFVEVGGGIRSMEVAQRYISAGVSRIILGTAALRDRALLISLLDRFADKVAVGVDISDGKVAVGGWQERTSADAFMFCRDMQSLGVTNIICTDISRDGAMQGTNRQLYRDLSRELHMTITASGGVSTLDDIRALRDMELYGAIIGKAYYTGAIDLREALEAAR